MQRNTGHGTIRRITVRKCTTAINKGRYTTGETDPDCINIVIEVSNGKVSGFGEFVPTSLIYPPGHIGRSALDEWGISLKTAQNLLGKDCRILGNWIPEELKCHDANSIVDGFDFAIHDLAGQIFNLPATAFLGGRKHDRVWNMDVIRTDEPDIMAKTALEFQRQRHTRYFKLKPNGEMEKDYETIRKIRELTLPGSHIFIDPNYALKEQHPDAVVKYLNRLHELGLEVCEDPIKTDWATFRYIKERTKVKIMIDECARSPESIMAIANAGCADLINIHANWAGGFQRALLKAGIAAVGGIECLVGSTFLLGMGVAGYRILTSLLPGNLAICEQENAVYCCQGFTVVKKEYEEVDGASLIPDTPGLGVDVDMDKLEQVTFETVNVE